MASKFHGTFEVTADFVNEYVDYAVAYEVGDWLLVCHYNGIYYLPDESVEVYGRDDTRKDALDYLRYCLRSDYYRNVSYDYEIWHVVETPDWMPVPNPVTAVTSIVLLDHANRGVWDETLVRVCTKDFPIGISVLVTDWGLYVPTDWDVLNQPRTLAEVGSAGTVDFMEVNSCRNDWLFQLVPAFLALA